MYLGRSLANNHYDSNYLEHMCIAHRRTHQFVCYWAWGEGGENREDTHSSFIMFDDEMEFESLKIGADSGKQYELSALSSGHN